MGTKKWGRFFFFSASIRGQDENCKKIEPSPIYVFYYLFSFQESIFEFFYAV